MSNTSFGIESSYFIPIKTGSLKLFPLSVDKTVSAFAIPAKNKTTNKKTIGLINTTPQQLAPKSFHNAPFHPNKLCCLLLLLRTIHHRSQFRQFDARYACCRIVVQKQSSCPHSNPLSVEQRPQGLNRHEYLETSNQLTWFEPYKSYLHLVVLNTHRCKENKHRSLKNNFAFHRSSQNSLYRLEDQQLYLEPVTILLLFPK